MYAGTIEINEEVIPNLSFSLKPTAEGHNLAGVTDGGYELRSRGPASQGFEALDRFEVRVVELETFVLSSPHLPLAFSTINCCGCCTEVYNIPLSVSLWSICSAPTKLRT